MTTDRAMVERAPYVRAERLAGIDRRDHCRCYDYDRFVPFADDRAFPPVVFESSNDTRSRSLRRGRSATT
jgi:hypothetical protein